MDIKVDDLRLFLLVAEQGSITAAAKAAHITQQGLSSAMRRLERSAGAQLFERGHAGVSLTETGLRLISVSREILNLVRESRGPLERPLTVGIVSPAAAGISTSSIASFRRMHPGTIVRLRQLTFRDIELNLALDRVDVALTLAPFSFPGWRSVPLYSEALSLIVPTLHPAAKTPSVSAAEVLSEVFIDGASLPDGWTMVGRLEELRRGSAARLGLPDATDPQSPVEVNEVVAAGLALVAGPISHGRVFPHPHVRCVPLLDSPQVTVVIAWRRDHFDPLIRSLVRHAFAATETYAREPGSQIRLVENSDRWLRN